MNWFPMTPPTSNRELVSLPWALETRTEPSFLGPVSKFASRLLPLVPHTKRACVLCARLRDRMASGLRHIFESCRTVTVPAIASCKAARSTVPFVRPSASMSRVSVQMMASTTSLSSSSRRNWMCESRLDSAGTLICTAVVAANTDIESTTSTILVARPPSRRSLRASHFEQAPVCTSCNSCARSKARSGQWRRKHRTTQS